MLCDPPPTNEAILPQAKQGSYFFNRIGHQPLLVNDGYRPKEDEPPLFYADSAIFQN